MALQRPAVLLTGGCVRVLGKSMRRGARRRGAGARRVAEGAAAARRRVGGRVEVHLLAPRRRLHRRRLRQRNGSSSEGSAEARCADGGWWLGRAPAWRRGFEAAAADGERARRRGMRAAAGGHAGRSAGRRVSLLRHRRRSKEACDRLTHVAWQGPRIDLGPSARNGAAFSWCGRGLRREVTTARLDPRRAQARSGELGGDRTCGERSSRKASISRSTLTNSLRSLAGRWPSLHRRRRISASTSGSGGGAGFGRCDVSRKYASISSSNAVVSSAAVSAPVARGGARSANRIAPRGLARLPRPSCPGQPFVPVQASPAAKPRRQTPFFQRAAALLRGVPAASDEGPPRSGVTRDPRSRDAPHAKPGGGARRMNARRAACGVVGWHWRCG